MIAFLLFSSLAFAGNAVPPPEPIKETATAPLPPLRPKPEPVKPAPARPAARPDPILRGEAGRTTRNVQRAECFPTGSYAANWPVDAIYLHGHFHKDGRKQQFLNWENANRDKLQELATRLKIRIAVPISPVVNRGSGKLEWNTVPLSKIEELARSACGNVPLAPRRAIIGFSNGGYKARDIAKLSCAAQSKYPVILSIGAPKNTIKGACGNLVTTPDHVFPGQSYFRTNLAAITKVSPVRAADAAPNASR